MCALPVVLAVLLLGGVKLPLGRLVCWLVGKGFGINARHVDVWC
jgi:hypothetical protein